MATEQGGGEKEVEEEEVEEGEGGRHVEANDIMIMITIIMLLLD